ncbi:hypothetical protein MJ581_19720 [Escherichia coli]|nr:hypothetical protein MJ581_19720 [Escherichia coli]
MKPPVAAAVMNARKTTARQPNRVGEAQPAGNSAMMDAGGGNGQKR